MCVCVCVCLHVWLCACGFDGVQRCEGCPISHKYDFFVGMCDVTINQWKLLACFIDVFRYRWAVWFGYKDYNLS